MAEIIEAIPAERLESAVVQIDLAKNFTLMGLHSIARMLATTNTTELRTLPKLNYGEAEALSAPSG